MPPGLVCSVSILHSLNLRVRYRNYEFSMCCYRGISNRDLVLMFEFELFIYFYLIIFIYLFLFYVNIKRCLDPEAGRRR